MSEDDLDPSEFKDRHCLILGIRVFDAAFHNFEVPKGSKPKPCRLCGEATYVQKSMLKLIARGVEHSVVCFRCQHHLPMHLLEPGNCRIVPEAVPEVIGMLKTRRQ